MPRWIVPTALACAFALMLALLSLPLWIKHANAAPRAGSAEECAGIADMAITARAMAEEKVAQEVAGRVLARMYPKELLAKWSESIVRTAYNEARGAAAFASDLLLACRRSGGVVDGVLGVSL